jgi:hypothetical protein
MANPFPFTSGQVLTAAQLNGIGEITTFTPSWASLTVGNGTQSFKYVRVQNLVFVTGRITFGTTTAITGNVSLAVPIISSNQSDLSIVGQTYLQDAGAGNLLGIVAYFSNNLFLQNMVVNGVYPQPDTFSATSPFTWAVNDSIIVQATYAL